ncbi:hypothetical protein [Paracidobacterium acidisoli]|uniref:hypothetical protein n=1 Tax=Paracidobacterium acidisoli TaxID=2303751 RepID=UPI0011C11371|nr:hypothetical protein [Paracidobacterium acidisoli]MBT9330822.1 hypothetical protein [Paracidobacterium acidisoli]
MEFVFLSKKSGFERPDTAPPESDFMPPQNGINGARCLSVPRDASLWSACLVTGNRHGSLLSPIAGSAVKCSNPVADPEAPGRFAHVSGRSGFNLNTLDCHWIRARIRTRLSSVRHLSQIVFKMRNSLIPCVFSQQLSLEIAVSSQLKLCT